MGKGRLDEVGFEDLVRTSKAIANSNIKSTQLEVGSLLDTFDDDISDDFRKKLEGRVPELFSEEEASSQLPESGEEITLPNGVRVIRVK